MRSYKTFNADELAKWQADVTQYMTDVHPTLDGITRWEDMPEAFFNPGCELAKAIVIARDAANNPKQYKPQQAVRVIGGFLRPHTRPLSPLPQRGEPEHSSVSTQGQSGKATQQRRPNANAMGTVAAQGTGTKTANGGSLALKGEGGGEGLDRGTHLSEYLYMLNDEVKAEAERLPELYLQQATLAQDSEAFAKTYIDAENEGNTELMDLVAEKAEPTNRALVEVNQSIRAIWEMVDEGVEYYRKEKTPMPLTPQPQTPQPQTPQPPKGGEKDGGATAANAIGTVAASGTAASGDALPLQGVGGSVLPLQGAGGSALPLQGAGGSGLPPIGKKPAECTKAEIDAIADPALQHKYMEIRIEANKKYLRRTDLNETDEWKEQVRLRSQELIDWEVKITDKIYATIERARTHPLTPSLN